MDLNFFKKHKHNVLVYSFCGMGVNIKADCLGFMKDIFSNIFNGNNFDKITQTLDLRGKILDILNVDNKNAGKSDEIIANLLSTYLFPVKDITDFKVCAKTGVYYKIFEKNDKNKNTLIICCHGITDTIEEFYESQKHISNYFDCDSISLEYNFYNEGGTKKASNITKMKEMSGKLYEFLKDYLAANKQYENIIFYGYSHGNLYMIDVFKEFISKAKTNNDNHKYTFIGDKGYCNLSQALNVIVGEQINEISNNSGDLIKFLFNLIKTVSDNNRLNYLVRFIIGENLYNKIIDQSDNYKKLKEIKGSLNIYYQKLATKEHFISENGIKEIVGFYNKNKATGDNEKYYCYLFSADDDNIVGDGFEKMFYCLKKSEDLKYIDFAELEKSFQDEKNKKENGGGNDGKEDKKKICNCLPC